MPPGMLSLDEFCRSVRISRTFLYSLPPEQWPTVMRLAPRKIFVTPEARDAWIAKRSAHVAAA
jgi:hypothetical protein